jgi:hypothetical protein
MVEEAFPRPGTEAYNAKWRGTPAKKKRKKMPWER